MKFSVITVFPQMIQEALAWGVVGKALDKKIFECHTINPRDFTSDVHKTIDDRPFGGGDGMVMLYEPLAKAIESVPNFQAAKKIYLSPVGRKLDETLVRELGKHREFLLLSGRYGGVDQRLLNDYEFMNVSIGDYVVSGGELPALVLMDALMRKEPGVLGNGESPSNDSFAQLPYFEAPLFTRPRENKGGKVPEVLVGGDHKKIEEFRRQIGLALTLQNRPELLGAGLSAQERQSLKAYLQTLADSDLTMLGITLDFRERL